ncbi:Protein FLX-like 2 [Linum grandiflorum]
METNYMTMAREVEKLRSQLANIAGNSEIEAPGPWRAGGQSMYEDGYGVHQGQGYGAAAGNSGAAAVASNVAHAGAQTGSGVAKAGHEASKVPGYDPSKGPVFDPSRGPGYDVSRGGGYDAQRMHGYDVQRGMGYEMQQRAGVAGYDPAAHRHQWGANYDAARSAAYDALSRGQQGQMATATAPNNATFGSATPPAGRAGGGYDAAGNPTKR